MKKNGETTLADVVEAIEALGTRIGTLDAGVNQRLDGVLKLLGGHHRNHERRITALEKSVAALKKSA